MSFGWEVAIVDPDGRDLPVDTPGELLIRGECLFAGYWRDPEATAAAFADGGWYRTGDIARLTADGYLYILDRAKDMIISGGENIYPAEVEAVLAEHPAVADVAVARPARSDLGRGRARRHHPGGRAGRRRLGRGDHRLVPRPASALQMPQDVEFVDSLPRTTTGKVLKRELREQLRRSRGRLALMSLPLGLSIASHSGLPAAAVGELAAAAEPAGFSAVFVAEGHGDALALCHPVTAATRRVRVGTAIANAALRPPVLAAKTAAQLDQASDGRFMLGLGVANEVMNGRFGLAPFPPLAMIEEYVAVVRAVLAGTRPVMTARCSAPAWFRSTARRCAPAADLPGRARAADAGAGRPDRRRRDPQPDVAGPGRAGGGRRPRGRGAAGRDPAPSRSPAWCTAASPTIRPRARPPAAARRGRSALHPASGRPAAVRRAGRRPESARAGAVLAGDRAGAATRCRSRWLTPSWPWRADECLARVAEYPAAGVDLPILFPMPVDGDWGYEKTIAAMAGKAR